MIPDFYVFDTEFAASIITNIENLGFNVFVSGKCDETWLRERFVNRNRYLIFWDFHRNVHLGDLEFEAPLLIISVPQDYDHWEYVAGWIQTEVFKLDLTYSLEPLGFEKPSTQKREYTPGGEEAIVDGLKSHIISTPPTAIDKMRAYTFNSHYDEVMDIKYYEVVAPSSPIPFTVVIYAFSKKDDSWFFSDIYACNAWGRNMMESRHDFSFLQEVWKYLELPGQFTMDVVKRRVDACYLDRVKDISELEAEPSVYRRSMKSVMEM